MDIILEKIKMAKNFGKFISRQIKNMVLGF